MPDLFLLVGQIPHHVLSVLPLGWDGMLGGNCRPCCCCQGGKGLVWGRARTSLPCLPPCFKHPQSQEGGPGPHPHGGRGAIGFNGTKWRREGGKILDATTTMRRLKRHWRATHLVPTAPSAFLSPPPLLSILQHFFFPFFFPFSCRLSFLAKKPKKFRCPI